MEERDEEYSIRWCGRGDITEGILLAGTLRQEKAMERLGEGAFQADRRLKVLTTELDSLVQRAERTL